MNLEPGQGGGGGGAELQSRISGSQQPRALQPLPATATARPGRTGWRDEEGGQVRGQL